VQVYWGQVAQAQAGVVTTAQLAAAGHDRAAVCRMLGAGELVNLCRGVHLAGAAPLTFEARLWAALLATRGALARSTAGRLWGVVDEGDDVVHVVVPHARRIAVPLGVAVHRKVLPVDAVIDKNGRLLTTRAWTVLDLISTLPYREASRLADRALQRQWIEPADCHLRLRSHPRCPGNGQLRKIAAMVSDGAAAQSERVLHRLLRRAGVVGWVPNHEVWHAGELVAVVDVAIPGRRVAIEIDGMAYHVDVDRFRRDRSRQNALVALGWTVLRFTWADLIERPGYVIATIQRLAA
jgi:very-short-patch-repair endonuclease